MHHAGNSNGGLIAQNGTLVLRRCLITENAGDAVRGGLSFADGVADVADCLFSDNTASLCGGMSVENGDALIRNGTFARNSVHALRASGSGTEVTVENCIFRDDEPPEIEMIAPASVSVHSSDVHGGWSGPGANNIDADPEFAPGPAGTWTEVPSFDAATALTTFTDAGASFEPGALVGEVILPATAIPLNTAVAANTATTVSVVGQIWSLIVPSGAEYEIFSNRLLPGSPCIDAGDNAFAGFGTTDLDGNPRIVGDPDAPDTGQGDCPIVDMGAYEYQPAVPECPPCPDCAPPADGTVDVLDFLVLLSAWGSAGPCDLDGNGSVDVLDMLILLGAWGSCP